MSRNGESKLKVLKELRVDRFGVESHCYVTWERRKKGEGEIWWIKERKKKGKLIGGGKKREKKRKLRFYRTFSSPRPFTQLEGTSFVFEKCEEQTLLKLKGKQLGHKVHPSAPWLNFCLFPSAPKSCENKKQLNYKQNHSPKSQR